MGARVGKNVCILGSNCVELDQVSIGDGTGAHRSFYWCCAVLCCVLRHVLCCAACCLPLLLPRNQCGLSPPPPLSSSVAVINEMSFIMGHTVENRAVKIGRVT